LALRACRTLWARRPLLVPREALLEEKRLVQEQGVAGEDARRGLRLHAQHARRDVVAGSDHSADDSRGRERGRAEREHENANQSVGDQTGASFERHFVSPLAGYMAGLLSSVSA
jgi:hypothetical protein